jgi:hypothetical protein
MPGRSSCIGRWFVMGGSIRNGGGVADRTTSGGNDTGRWVVADGHHGGVHLVDGKASVVTGIDDNSRFSCAVVDDSAAKCDALTEVMGRHGLPEEVLTDNGKVFTGRYRPRSSGVLFKRTCRKNSMVPVPQGLEQTFLRCVPFFTSQPASLILALL